VEIGQGKHSVSTIAEGIATGKLPLNGLAPAQGLVLEEVSYKKN
jgi:tRNA U38,U39,U40 pseudouridine synthase TruA